MSNADIIQLSEKRAARKPSPSEEIERLRALAAAALERATEARNAAWKLYDKKKEQSGQRREVYSVADPERPWDVIGGDETSVAAKVKERADRAALLLLANNPGEAARLFRWCAGHIEGAMERVDELERARRKRAAARRRLKRSRDELKKELARLEREAAKLGQEEAR